MSMDTTTPARVSATIYAGATFRKGWARLVGGQPDDYTGCTAIAELRDGSSNALLATFSSAGGATGSIIATGNRLELYLSFTATKALTPFESGVCHVELRRPAGTVERLYEIAFGYSPESTIADPPAP